MHNPIVAVPACTRANRSTITTKPQQRNLKDVCPNWWRELRMVMAFTITVLKLLCRVASTKYDKPTRSACYSIAVQRP
jgi:hypothetical protein